MSAKHQHLALEQVTPGMILSDQLLGLQGQVLLPQGTVLTESMLANLPRHGIEMLPVLVEEQLSPQQRDAARAVRMERLAQLFRKHPADDEAQTATGVLYHLMSAYRASADDKEPA